MRVRRAARAALLLLAPFCLSQGRSNVNTKTDYYKLLKLKRDFSGDDLKKAYRAAAKRYHPDKNPGDRPARTQSPVSTEYPRRGRGVAAELVSAE